MCNKKQTIDRVSNTVSKCQGIFTENLTIFISNEEKTKHVGIRI